MQLLKKGLILKLLKPLIFDIAMEDIPGISHTEQNTGSTCNVFLR